MSVLERRYGGWDGQSAWCENGFDHQRDGGTEDGAEGRPADGRTLDHVLDGLRFAVVGLRVGGWVGKEVSGHVVGVPDAVSVETINACGWQKLAGRTKPLLAAPRRSLRRRTSG